MGPDFARILTIRLLVKKWSETSQEERIPLEELQQIFQDMRKNGKQDMQTDPGWELYQWKENLPMEIQASLDYIESDNAVCNEVAERSKCGLEMTDMCYEDMILSLCKPYVISEEKRHKIRQWKMAEEEKRQKVEKQKKKEQSFTIDFNQKIDSGD